MKLRTRIILLLSITFASFILLFSIVMYLLSANYVFDDFYGRLKTRTNTTIHIELNHNNEKEWVSKFKNQYLELLPDEKSAVIEVTPRNIPPNYKKLNKEHKELIQKILKNQELEERHGDRLIYGRVYYASNGKKYVAYTYARDLDYKRFKRFLSGLLVVMFLSSVILIFLISIGLSKRLVRPLQKLNRSIEEINAENLRYRINVSEEKDELNELIQTMNLMFDRLETSFDIQNNFVSNASHELNTPLTGIIGQADLMLAKDRTEKEYKEAIFRILNQAEELSKKTQALLFLAKTGFDGEKVLIEEIRLDELIFETIQTVTAIYPNSLLKFDYSTLPETDSWLIIKGNAQLLQLALSNLLINAIKYSSNKEVKIYMDFNETESKILIQDQGIGIPAAELERIYDTFYRASNTSKIAGYGVGLSLTRNIIRLHKGIITIQSEEGKGTLVSLTFPHTL